MSFIEKFEEEQHCELKWVDLIRVPRYRGRRTEVMNRDDRRRTRTYSGSQNRRRGSRIRIREVDVATAIGMEVVSVTVYTMQHIGMEAASEL